MSWARRLKRVFRNDIVTCARCGGRLRIIASIEEPQVIAKILAQLERIASQSPPTECSLGARATGAVQAALNSKRRGTGAGRQGGGLGTGARRQAGPGLWLGGHGVRPRARPGIQRPALRPTGHAGRRNDRPRTVGLRLEPGLLARYANSLRTGRRFEFPIRCHYSLEAARSAITRSSFATKSALASIRSISARCRSTSALTRAISLR